jgi:hypothetical protein
LESTLYRHDETSLIYGLLIVALGHTFLDTSVNPNLELTMRSFASQAPAIYTLLQLNRNLTTSLDIFDIPPAQQLHVGVIDI